MVGVHLHFEKLHARKFGLHFVNVFGCFGAELKRREDEQFGARDSRAGFLPGVLHLALLQRRVLRAEGDHHAVSGQ